MSIRQRPWNVVVLALATVALNAGEAASQLITGRRTVRGVRGSPFR